LENGNNTMDGILQYLPASLGMFVVIASAGFLGLFKTFMLARKSDDDAIASLERQLQIQKDEIESLKEQIEILKLALSEKYRNFNE